jgi:MoaA/NifB/PqqE/SkfB family radical SAM enzyme
MNVSSLTNRALQKMSLVTGLSLNKPTYICAKMTMRCNSRCIHCNIWKTKYDIEELSTAQWIRILDQLRQWLGVFNMVFTGGEALLRPDMLAILIHAVGLGINVTLLSNGLIIDETMAEAIISTGIAQVTISVDGLSAAIHDGFRGEAGFYEKTISTILILNRLRRQNAKPMRLLLKTVISANNLHELPALAIWAKKQGLEIQFQPIEQNYGEEPNPAWFLTSPLWIKNLDTLCKVIDELRQFKQQGFPIVNSESDFIRYSEYFRKPEELMVMIQAHYSKKQAKSCYAAMGDFVISCNGDVQMCFRMHPIGNAAAKPPQIIWQERQRCWAGPCNYR